MQYKGNTYGNVTRKNISLVIFMAILLILGLCGCSKGTAKTDNTVPKAPAAETERRSWTREKTFRHPVSYPALLQKEEK